MARQTEDDETTKEDEAVGFVEEVDAANDADILLMI
jgi:hypothetical protein